MSAYKQRRDAQEKAERYDKLLDRANRLLVNVERNSARQSADTLFAAVELRELLGAAP